MMEYSGILLKSKLFEGIKKEEINTMLSCLQAEMREFAKGEYIFRRNDTVSHIALLLEGAVHIQKEDYWGNLSILSEINKGELFGEAYACSGNTPMINNAVAVSAVKVLFMDINRILTTCPSGCRFHERVICNLLSVIASKNRMLTQKLEHMSQRTTREKLLSYLSEQSVKAESSSFDIPFNRQQLSDYLSVDRSAMSAELCKMRDEGLLEFQRNHFLLK